MNNLEQVLKRQRDRLENFGSTNRSNNNTNKMLHTNQSNNDIINFELSKASPMMTSKTMQGAASSLTGGRTNGGGNLEKAYEELEKEIFDIKQKLQKSLGSSSMQESQI